MESEAALAAPVPVGAAARWTHRLRSVSWREVMLLLEAQRDLVVCQLTRWRRPVAELLEAAGASTGPQDVDIRVIEQVGWAVTRAAVYGVFRPRCLVRSMAIRRMLERRGIVSGRMAIGVRLAPGGLLAHAWVELNGIIIGDSRAYVETFTRITDHRLVKL